MRLRCLVSALTMGALACVPYRPAPVDPGGLAVAYNSRRLDDTALVRFLSGAGLDPPDTAWRPRALSLVALYFHRDLDVGRAAWRQAVAAEITAGARPQPSAEATVTRAARPDEGKTTPWSVALAAGLTVETGGKRGARMARARAATLAAALDLDADAWRVAEAAEGAAAGAASADQELELVEAAASAERAVLSLLRARYSQGAATLSDVARAEAEVHAADLAVLEARRQRLSARADLSLAVALPAAQVDSLPLAFDSAPSCAVLDSMAVATLEREALQVRYDLGAALAAYAAADADVHFAVAEQYPDIVFGPGGGWDEGVGKWSVGLGLPRIVVIRNRGPIAEAEARRAGAAARFEQTQETVLAGVTTAVTQCRQARAELVQTDTLVAAAARRLALVQAAYERGEMGQSEVAFARLALVRAGLARAMAAHRQEIAGVGLERAVGRWLVPPLPRWPDVTQSPRK